MGWHQESSEPVLDRERREQARGDSTAPLETALRSLPRAQASPEFTRRVMARIASAPRRPVQAPWTLVAAAAAAVLLLWLAPLAWESLESPRSASSSVPRAAAAGTPAAFDHSSLDGHQIEQLRARRAELEQELQALRRLHAELPPVIGVEGPSADYLVDLGELSRDQRGSAAAIPASYRTRP